MNSYVPNKIPTGQRRVLLISSLLLFAYGTWGVWRNDLAFPIYFHRGGYPRTNRPPWLHLHDAAAWAIYGAIICACLVMLSIVMDHYDRRNNERHYKTFAQMFTYAGWTLGIASIAAWLTAGA